MDNKELLAYRKRLLEGGIRPDLVRRHLRELRDHSAEVREAAQLQGMSAQEAAQHARRQLGTPEQLAAEMLARPELRSRWHRHPVLLLVLAPLFGYVLLYVASVLALLVASVGLDNLVNDVPPASATAWMMESFDTLRFVLHYLVPPLVVAAITMIGIRQHVPARVWVTGMALSCVLGSSVQLFVAAPDPALGEPGMMGVGMFFAPYELEAFSPFGRRDHNFRLLLNLLMGGGLAWVLRRREQAAMADLRSL